MSIQSLDMMNEKFSDLQQQLKKESEDLKLLQSHKVTLMKVKKKLLQEIKPEESTPEHHSAVTFDPKLYKRLLPLVTEIHELEIRKQEMQHQLHLVEVHKDIKDIFTTLTSVANKEDGGILQAWFEELKSAFKGGEKTPECITKQPNYKSSVESDRLVETLGFTVFYCGLSVHVTMSSQSSLSDNSSCTQNIPISTDTIISVLSDIHIQGLEDKTKHFLKLNNSAMDLIQFIKDSLDNGIVPYM